MIDHLAFETSDLDRAGRFYDALFFALGVRRMVQNDQAIAYGVNEPVLYLVARGRAPGAGYGHVALRATGRAAVEAAFHAALRAGGRDDGAPAHRPEYGRRYYSAYLLDPDGLRVEIVAR